MGILQIDETKCSKDGICALECPMAIIRLEGRDGYPAMVAGGEEFCMICGHCVSVCPHGALNHTRIPIEDCVAIRDKLAIEHDQAVQFIRSRRSIRRYREKPVEKNKIQRLIEIARYAPTASNSQLVEWLVITEKTEIKKLAALTVDWIRDALEKDPQGAGPAYMSRIVAAWEAGSDMVLRGAPVLIVASASEEARHGMVDVALALSYLELAAPTLGLASCLAGLVQRGLLFWPPLKAALGLPAGHPNHYPVMLGYPKVRYHLLPERKPPKITWR